MLAKHTHAANPLLEAWAKIQKWWSNAFPKLEAPNPDPKTRHQLRTPNLDSTTGNKHRTPTPEWEVV